MGGPPTTLCLASLRSPYAPTYTAVGTLWLLSIAVGAATPRRGLTTLVAIAWVLLQGSPPVFSAAGNALASFPVQVATIAIAVLAVWPRRAGTLQPKPTGGEPLGDADRG